MLKVVGGGLLLLGGWALGAYLVMRERRNIQVEEGLLDLLRYIRAQLASFSPTRERLFETYEHARLTEVGFLPALRESGRMKQALDTCHGMLDSEVASWMIAFDHELGRTYLDGQLAACDYYIARLESHLAARRAAQATRARVQRTVPPAGAALLMLLLL